MSSSSCSCCAGGHPRTGIFRATPASATPSSRPACRASSSSCWRITWSQRRCSASGRRCSISCSSAVDLAARFLAVAVDRRGRGCAAVPAGPAGSCRSSSFSDVPAHSLLYHLSRSIVLLGSGVIAGIVAGSLRRQFEKSVAAAAARDRVTNMFGQHVSPAVVDRLLASHSRPAERDCARSACCSSTSGASPP